MERKTVKKDIELEGFGIHTGKRSKIIIHPAENDGGAIVFVKGKQKIKASVDNVSGVNFSTAIGINGNSVRTIEHLMSAFYGLGITDAIVEVYGDEIPALDGSARDFVNAIKNAGLEGIGKPRKLLVVKDRFRVEGENGAYVEVYPSDKLHFYCAISYDHPSLKFQKIELDMDEEVYEKEISPARTFCFYEQIAPLLKQGLGRGGNYRNVVVIGKEGVVNGPARFDDEPVRHKLLDLIGDFSLLGFGIKGGIKAYKSGHALHIKFLREFLESDVYEVVPSF